MKTWKRIGEPVVIHDGWRKIYRKRFMRNNGAIVEAEVMDNNHRAACVIALTKDNRVIIARQFRCGPEKVFDELPGGAVDKNEDPMNAVKRELEEETGYNAGKITELGIAHKNAWLDKTWYYYLATGCTKNSKGQQLDSFEEIEVDLISVDQLIQNAKQAKMTDPDAVFFAYDELLKVKKMDESV